MFIRVISYLDNGYLMSGIHENTEFSYHKNIRKKSEIKIDFYQLSFPNVTEQKKYIFTLNFYINLKVYIMNYGNMDIKR